ncbi:MAG: IS200/IS605 family transposase [Pyrinomonadaceae bacterium]|nr:IS200/IS605 family transposase [Phycisphaerales bacterium]
MPTSWTHNLYHAIVSTKGRAAVITPAVEEGLYACVGAILTDLRCTPIAINGMPDHIHILARYPSDLCHDEMVREVQQRSGAWIRETFPELKGFAWQDGYGGFSVSKSMQENIAAYIRKQDRHHLLKTSLEELEGFLQKYGVEYDPERLE